MGLSPGVSSPKACGRSADADRAAARERADRRDRPEQALRLIEGIRLPTPELWLNLQKTALTCDPRGQKIAAERTGFEPSVNDRARRDG